MPVYVSPGVYIREIDLSLYAPQISTCILANLGTATKGPVNKAIYVSAHTQFIREFGNPHGDHLATLAHLQFLSKGNQSYFTRITDGTETNAAAPVNADEGPAVVEGTEEGPFSLTAATYGTIEGLEAQPFTITESTTFKCAGGTSSGNLAAFQLISDGEFRMVYTDRAGSSSNIDVTGLDFTSDLSLDDVADTIQAGIRAATSRLEEYDYVGSDHFTLTSDVNETGSNVDATFAAIPGGTGTDIHGASYMVMATVTPTYGTDGNDVIILAADGGSDQEVRFRNTDTTAQNICDAINGVTSGVTAWPETVGANTFVYVRTNTLGSTGEIEFKDVPSTIEGYTDVFGVSIPASEVGTDGDVALTVWVNPFGYYKSGDSSANLANFQAISDGSIRVDLDGAGVLEASSMDFTSATNMGDVAQVIETAIKGLAWPGNEDIKVEWSNGYFYFISNDETTPTHGASSTVTLNTGTVGTNILQAGYIEAGSSTAGAASQLFNLSPGTVTTDAIVADLATLSGAEASNYKNYVRITTDMEGPAASLLIDATSTADTPLGFDNDYHWGTGSEAATFTLYAPTPGTDGNNLSAEISEGYQKTLHERWVLDNPAESEEDSPYYEFVEAFKLDLYYSGVRIGSYDNLTVNDPDADSFIETQLGNLSSEYNPATLVVAEDSGSGLMPQYGTYEFGETPATEGSNGASSLLPAHYIGVTADPGTGKPTGMQVYANAETFDMNLLIVPGVADTAVQTAMISLCEARADAMCIIDPPFGLSGPQAVVDWSNKQNAYAPGQPINSSYAATYWPWIKVYDSVNAAEVWTPPSGHVAAIYAYTDYISEPWFAPAGYNRAHIVVGLDLEMSPSQGDRDLMYGYPNVVNPIVNFFPDGITVWGQKTTQRMPSATDRVNVRRLLLYARKLVATVVRYLVFEPNDEVTWRWFVALCEPIFANIQRRRGLYEFRVVCDETTNLPDQIDRGEMNGRIYLKPTKAAEVITVDFVITTTGASFDEIEY